MEVSREETKKKFPWRQAIPLYSEIAREEVLDEIRVGFEVVEFHPTLRVINSYKVKNVTAPISPFSLKAAFVRIIPEKVINFSIEEIAGVTSSI